MLAFEIVGELIERRRILGLSQRGLARRIGVHARTLQRWEEEGLRPTLFNAALWAETLGLELRLADRRESIL